MIVNKQYLNRPRLQMEMENAYNMRVKNNWIRIVTSGKLFKLTALTNQLAWSAIILGLMLNLRKKKGYIYIYINNNIFLLFFHNKNNQKMQ